MDVKYVKCSITSQQSLNIMRSATLATLSLLVVFSLLLVHRPFLRPENNQSQFRSSFGLLDLHQYNFPVVGRNVGLVADTTSTNAYFLFCSPRIWGFGASCLVFTITYALLAVYGFFSGQFLQPDVNTDPAYNAQNYSHAQYNSDLTSRARYRFDAGFSNDIGECWKTWKISIGR